jgi:hypothetical protein
MITVLFPIEINGQLENDICDWLSENAEHIQMGGDYDDFIIFEDAELAIYFKLKFGL